MTSSPSITGENGRKSEEQVDDFKRIIDAGRRSRAKRRRGSNLADLIETPAELLNSSPPPPPPPPFSSMKTRLNPPSPPPPSEEPPVFYSRINPSDVSRRAGDAAVDGGVVTSLRVPVFVDADVTVVTQEDSVDTADASLSDSSKAKFSSETPDFNDVTELPKALECDDLIIESLEVSELNGESTSVFGTIDSSAPNGVLTESDVTTTIAESPTTTRTPNGIHESTENHGVNNAAEYDEAVDNDSRVEQEDSSVDDATDECKIESVLECEIVGEPEEFHGDLSLASSVPESNCRDSAVDSVVDGSTDVEADEAPTDESPSVSCISDDEEEEEDDTCSREPAKIPSIVEEATEEADEVVKKSLARKIIISSSSSSSSGVAAVEVIKSAVNKVSSKLRSSSKLNDPTSTRKQYKVTTGTTATTAATKGRNRVPPAGGEKHPRALRSAEQRGQRAKSAVEGGRETAAEVRIKTTRPGVKPTCKSPASRPSFTSSQNLKNKPRPLNLTGRQRSMGLAASGNKSTATSTLSNRLNSATSSRQNAVGATANGRLTSSSSSSASAKANSGSRPKSCANPTRKQISLKSSTEAATVRLGATSVTFKNRPANSASSKLNPTANITPTGSKLKSVNKVTSNRISSAARPKGKTATVAASARQPSKVTVSPSKLRMRPARQLVNGKCKLITNSDDISAAATTEQKQMTTNIH